MQRLVIDTDPGIDDVLALTMACNHELAKVEALTIVAGNTSVKLAAANACKALDALNYADIPVYAGADRAILGGQLRATSHGTDGLGDADIPASPRAVSSIHAVNRLIELGNQFPNELSLVCLGPLTNVALALSIDPDLSKKYRSLFVMGGAVHGRGNMHDGASEFNFVVDPEAVAIVFDRWPDLTLVPWETTFSQMLSMEKVKELVSQRSNIARFVNDISKHRAYSAFAEVGRQGWFVPDPVAMAVALDRSIIVEEGYYPVAVELKDEKRRGQIVVDWKRKSEAKNVRIVTKVDGNKFWNLLRRSFAHADTTQSATQGTFSTL